MKKEIHIPPHNQDAERSVLGAIMIERDAMLSVSDLLSPEDFYFDTHSIIYRSMTELYNKRAPIDILTVEAALADQGKLDLIGGRRFLQDLVSDVLTAAHIVSYALIIKEKSTLRKLIHAGTTITGLGFKEDEETDLLVDQAEQALFKVSQAFIRNRFIPIKEVLSTTFEKISDLHDPNLAQNYKGLSSGFPSMDELLTGFQSSDLIILAARPAMGKTAFALNLALNMGSKGKSVGLISLEMSKEQLVERLLVAELKVDSWKVKNGNLDPQDFARMGEVMDKLNRCKIFIDDSPGASVTELRAKARRLQMEHGLDCLMIDYLQLMTHGKGGGSITNRVQEISEISRSLKQLARELHIPIIALSQLSRAVESRPDKRPQLSDLRESGAIEQDADVVLMMYRDDYYEEDSQRAGITDLFVRKHRHGATGRVELIFKKEHMRFYEIDRHHRSTDAYE